MRMNLDVKITTGCNIPFEIRQRFAAYCNKNNMTGSEVFRKALTLLDKELFPNAIPSKDPVNFAARVTTKDKQLIEDKANELTNGNKSKLVTGLIIMYLIKHDSS